MSLQVWLPLTKDLRQQGLSDVEVTNNGAVFNSAGKLGGCYNFGTGASSLSLPKSFFTSFTGDFSIACWVKIITWNSSYATIWAATSTSASWQNIMAGLFRYGSQSKILFCIGNDSSSTQSNCITTEDIQLNTWYHFVCTYTSGKIRLYQNGELVSSYNTSIVPKFSSTQYFNIGKMRENTYQTNSNINDFRLYDHCLSPMEVKQISQGLVLHYPLNREGWGQRNLLKNSFIENSHVYNSGSLIYYYYDFNGNLPAGTYTCSFDIKSSNGTESAYCSYATNSSTIQRICSLTNIPSTWTHYSFTFKVTSTSSNDIFFAHYTGHGSPFNANNKGYIYVKNVKLEEGAIETFWSPADSDELTGKMGLNNNIEYDCSGFCNNGTRTGTFTWSSDTPKYNVSQYFNGSSYILTNSGTFSWFDFNKCTIAVWMKPTTTPSSWAGTFGIAHNNSSSNKSFVIGNYGGKFTVQSANGGWVNIQSSDLPINEWHYCVATLDGTNIKMYFDGELVKTYTTSWGSTTVASDTRVQVGNDLPGSDEIYQGYYSDARIYATALSADDVRALYENSAYIDNSGNTYAAIYTEV